MSLMRALAMIFTTFDRPALYNLIQNSVAREDFRIWTRTWNLLPNMNSNLAANITPVDQVSSEVVSVLPYYADQIPPSN